MAAAECEFAWLRGIDARLGRVAAVVEPEDATLEPSNGWAASMSAVCRGVPLTFGDRVVEIPETRSGDARPARSVRDEW